MSVKVPSKIDMRVCACVFVCLHPEFDLIPGTYLDMPKACCALSPKEFH